MILTAHQPQYLPGLRLFHKISCADRFIIFDVAQFERHSFENRNTILTSNGPLTLTVPVESKGHLEKTGGEIRVAQDGRWQSKHVRSIEMAYRRAPFFNDYFQSIKRLIEIPEQDLLLQVNMNLLIMLMAALGVKIWREEYACKFRPAGYKSGLVLDLCKKVGATSYIFGAKGRSYADVKAFEAAGVRPHFQQYIPQPYKQLHTKTFVPDLSVIDLLMNEGPRSLEIIMRGNETKDHYL